MRASALDVNMMTLTVYGEARGSSLKDKVAIAHVIMNRFKRPGWWTRHPGDDIPDDTLAAACIDPKQFSCWNDGDPNLRKIAIARSDSNVMQECRLAVLGALRGTFPDDTQGSCHYAVVGTDPYWAAGVVSVGVIGAHEFWNNIP